MLKRPKILAVILILCNALAAVAAEEDSSVLELTVEKALEYAIENNLSLKSAESDLKSRRFAMNSAWNEFVPQMAVSTTLSHLNEELYSELAGIIPGYVPPSQWNLQAQLSAQLTLSLHTAYKIKQTVIDYETGLISLDKAKSQLVRDTKKQFYGLLYLESQIKAQEITVNNAQARYNQARLDYQNGFISEYEMLNAQVYLENLKTVLVELENSFINTKMLFKVLLGIDLSTEITLNGTLDIAARSFDADKLIAKYINQTYDILETNQNITNLRNMLDLTGAALFPTITFSFIYDPTLNNPFENDLFAADNWQQMSGSFSVTLRQAIDPLLPASKTRVSMENLSNQLAVARDGLALAYAQVEMQIRNTVLSLEKSRTTINAKELSVQVAQKAYYLAEEAYAAGNIDQLQLKDSEHALHTAQLSLVGEKYNYLSGLLDLEFLLNISINDMESSHEE